MEYKTLEDTVSLLSTLFTHTRMGHYLSEPKTEKNSASGTADALRLSYASCSMQGWRRTMEDALQV